jgi:hypothetical protein
MKNPWVAFVLNLLFFGGGYIYNGKRIGLGFALILAWIVIRWGEIAIFLTNLVFDKWIILFSGLVVLMFTLAIDAYREARVINAQNKKEL